MTRHLTPREYEVLRLTASGLSTREICGQLGISRNTVCKYRQSLLDEFHVYNVVQLTLIAIAHGVIKITPIRNKLIVEDKHWKSLVPVPK